MKIKSFVWGLGLAFLVGAGVASCTASADGQSRDLARFITLYDYYVDPTALAEEKRTQMDLFRGVARRVQTAYVSPTDPKQLVDHAIRAVEELKPAPGSTPPNKLVETGLNAMLASLDPHSSLLTPEQYRDMAASTKGEFGGLGIEIAQENELIKVVAPIDDTPAAKAGLKPGDFITHVDDTPIKGMAIAQAVKRLRGPPNSSVRVTILRGEAAPFVVTLVRAIIVVKPVRARLEGEIGYIRLTSFNEHADEALKAAVADLERQAGARIKGYVLDLRNNAGGLLDQAVKISDAFLEAGEVVSIKSRRSGEERHKAGPGDLARGKPVVVLINAGSASASEIVAGAIQDHRRGTVIGVTSFGKGSVQTIMPLDQGYALKLTTALYYTPSGRSIQARGIEPDLVVAGDPAEVKREADLTHSLPASAAVVRKPPPSLPESACPNVGDGKDKLLGCGVALAASGNLDRFLAQTAPTTAAR
ncbi:MAG: S41 family peptidase [Rhodospirillales bacterium]|nr:S41 family peptidase [Rhodospirillales bacterium]